MDRPSVNGLRNLGNTCYLNAVLQALASCSSVLRQLTKALRQLERCQPPGQASSSSAAPAAPLAAALLDVLQLLQPHAAPSQTVVPRRLVDVFRGKLPPGVLEAGEEHDAAEAVEELCRLVAEEMQACFARCVQPQLAARAALAAALERRSAAGLLLGSTASRSCGSEASLAKLANGQAAPACNGHAVAAAADGAAAAQASAAAAAEAALDSTRVREPSGQPANAVLQGWQQQLLPLHGSTAHELQCLRCRHRSVVQLSPFWVLSLPIPTARGTTLLGNVPAAPAASLQHCLASAFGYEALQGWHCTRCSLAASLEAAQQPAAAAAAGEAEASLSAVVVTDAANSAAALGLAKQQEHQPDSAGALQAQLQRLHLGLAGGGRLAESESYGRMLSEAGLAWLPRPSPAAKRTVAARLPGVLCLQLRRGFWSEHGHVKVAGHVAFPLLLELPPELVPRLGHEPAPPPAAPDDLLADLQQQQRRVAPRYILRAVVVHHGPLAGAGHYTVYRSVGAVAGGGGSGDGSGSGSGGSSVHSGWVRASDETLQPTGLREVLEAEASMLVYEAC